VCVCACVSVDASVGELPNPVHMIMRRHIKRCSLVYILSARLRN